MVGAGVGGSVLAHALVRDGHEVVVLERDRDPADTGGYRLHLDARACAILRDVLPDGTWAAVQASAADRSSFRRFTLTDARMRVLSSEPRDTGEEVLMIGRVPLRRLLAAELNGQIRWGARARSVHADAERATVLLEDGSAVDADVVVGADGPRSAVVGSLVDHELVHPVGMGGIAGRTLLDDDTRALLPVVLRDGPLLAVAASGVVTFLTAHDPDRAGVVDRAPSTAPAAVVEPAALIWGVNADDRLLPPTERTQTGPALVQVADRLLNGWDDGVRRLVRQSDPSSVAAFTFFAPEPGAELMPWSGGRVTALGDAVHAVPPTGGQGATTAIRDASHLAARLRQVETTAELGSALAAYQRDVASYAHAAVAESLRPLRWARTLSRPGVRQLAQVVLPVAARLTDARARRRTVAAGSW